MNFGKGSKHAEKADQDELGQCHMVSVALGHNSLG